MISSHLFALFSRPPASLSTAERDLFLTITSQLKEFRPTRDTLFSNDFFLLCAQKYMLSGATIDVLCEHNAQVCKAAKQPQIAETWRLMRILIKAPQDISDDEEDYAVLISPVALGKEAMRPR